MFSIQHSYKYFSFTSRLRLRWKNNFQLLCVSSSRQLAADVCAMLIHFESRYFTSLFTFVISLICFFQSMFSDSRIPLHSTLNLVFYSSWGLTLTLNCCDRCKMDQLQVRRAKNDRFLFQLILCTEYFTILIATHLLSLSGFLAQWPKGRLRWHRQAATESSRWSCDGRS